MVAMSMVMSMVMGPAVDDDDNELLLVCCGHQAPDTTTKLKLTAAQPQRAAEQADHGQDKG